MNKNGILDIYLCVLYYEGLGFLGATKRYKGT